MKRKKVPIKLVVVFSLVLLVVLSLVLQDWSFYTLEAHRELDTCRTLWFSGLAVKKFSNCTDEKFGFYESLYGAAIDSAMEKSNHTLQPVLVLHQTAGENDGEELPMIGKFAQSLGAIVLKIHEVSFQEELDKQYHVPPENPHRVGVFVRMDIPAIIKNHKLLDRPGICKKHALYTDTDVLFPNEIMRKDINDIKKKLGNKIISYGPESRKIDGATNTGVMLMDIERFEKELLPDLLKFPRENGVTWGAYDQGHINTYYKSAWEKRKTRKILSMRWNWKVYWKGSWDRIKVIHLHGPKPGKGLEDLVHCRNSSIPKYQYLVTKGIKNNNGRTAKKALGLFQSTEARMNAFLSEQCALLKGT